MSIIIYYLIKCPEAMRKLREEIDSVLGDRQMTADDLARLPYLLGTHTYSFSAVTHFYADYSAVMRETLRLTPVAPGRIIEAMEPTTLKGGRYAIDKGQVILVAIHSAHRDPKVWGDDVSNSNTPYLFYER